MTECTCSDKWKRLNANGHSPACLMNISSGAAASPYRDGNPDHIDTDATLPIEERIIVSACRMKAEGRGVKRRVLVSFAKFYELHRRRTEKLRSGPHGEYVRLLTPAGYLWIVPTPDLADGSEEYRFEQREVAA